MSGASKKLMGTTAAAGGDLLAIEDVFSTYLYTGNGSSQVISNGIRLGQSNASGSIAFNAAANTYVNTSSNSGFAYNTNDFTYEAWIMPQVDDGTHSTSNRYIFDHGAGNEGILSYISGQFRYYNNTVGVKNTGVSINNYEWTHVAVMRQSGTTYVYKNGQIISSFADSHNFLGNTFILGNYNSDSSTPYKWKGLIADVRVSNIARYGASFTPPTDHFTSDANTLLLTGYGDNPLVDNGPNALTLTANGEARATTFGPFDAATPGEGGLVWRKSRTQPSGQGFFNQLVDTERGASQILIANTSDAQTSSFNGLSSFNADGFTMLGGDGVANQLGDTYASWTFRKAPRFFDVVTYTGDGTTGKSLAHNLGVEPGVVIIKKTDAASNWYVYHRDIGTGQYLQLNLTDAAVANSSYFVSASSTEFVLGSNGSVNGNGQSHVAYLFAHDPLGPSGDGSDGLIACGSVSHTNGSDTFVDLGWEPQWVLAKRTDSSANWVIADTMRGATVAPSGSWLLPNTSDAESSLTSFSPFSPAPNGFYFAGKGGGFFGTGNYIYIAIRRGPMRQPTSGTEVFAPVATDATNNPQAGFPLDLWWLKARNGNEIHVIMDRMRGTGKYLSSDSTAAEADNPANYYRIDNMTGGFSNGGTFSQYAHWLFRRAPGFFDVVAYTGDGVAGRTVPHNLGVAPEMMIVKRRNGVSSWITYWESLGATKGVFIDTNAPFTSNTYWNDTAPTDSVFSLGSGSTNTSSATFISYLFATLPGVSKVGSFTHTQGAATNVDCGFTSGARFVLMKQSNASGSWFVVDAARGIVSGNDPFLLLNTTDAENSSFDVVDPYSLGFAVGPDIGSGEYIFYAVA